jgi:hypothetical protein
MLMQMQCNYGAKHLRCYIGCLSFGFSFEQSKAWAGCNGPWAVIFALVDGFVVKMGYPILLVPNSSPRAFGGISFYSSKGLEMSDLFCVLKDFFGGSAPTRCSP